MTRFVALNVAMKIVGESDHPDKDTIVKLLEQCTWSISNRVWSEEKILAYCNKIMAEKGRVLTSDFSIPGAPGHGDIAHVFKMTAREFRDAYFPLKSPLSPMSMYFKHTAKEWTALFVDDYHRIQPKTQTEYNENRGEGLPRWNAIARMNNTTSWKELLIMLGLKTHTKTHRITTVNSTSKSQEAIEDFDAAEEQRSQPS